MTSLRLSRIKERILARLMIHKYVDIKAPEDERKYEILRHWIKRNISGIRTSKGTLKGKRTIVVYYQE